jgi:membrane bound O-acyltransferase family protein
VNAEMSEIIDRRPRSFFTPRGLELAPAVWAFLGWAPVAVLPVIAQLALLTSPAWVRMWSLVAALGLGLKWLTFLDARRAGLRPAPGRAAGYFLAWPGLDARAFLDRRRHGERGRAGEWLAVLAIVALGAGLLHGAAPAVLPSHPLAGGWLAMTGMILCLHFGAFHLLSLAWRGAGVDAPPIMRAPLLATSATEFWGARWNRAFSDVARRFIFAPIARRWGASAGTLAAFLASGLAHELVITVPAGAGYGLPTAYFLLQGAMVLFERTPFARRIGLGGGWRGRLVAIACMAGPVYWLFPPPFIRNVILPMLRDIGVA